MPPFSIETYKTNQSGWAYLIKNLQGKVIAGDVGFSSEAAAYLAAEKKF